MTQFVSARRFFLIKTNIQRIIHLLQVQDEGRVGVLPLRLRVEEDDLLAGDDDVELLPAVPADVLLGGHLLKNST